MLYYFLLCVATVCGTAKGVCSKKISLDVSDFKGASLINTIRMLMCACIGFLLVLFSNQVQFLSVEPLTMLVILVSGISNALFVTTWLITVKNGAVMLINVFNTLSCIIPIIFANIFFNESIYLSQILSFLILVLGTAVMADYSQKSIKKTSAKGWILLIITAVFQGLIYLTQKWLGYLTNNSIVSPCPSAIFNFYTYIVSFIFLLVLFSVLTIKDKVPFRQSFTIYNPKKTIFVILLLSLFLFFNSFFNTLVSAKLNAIITYPIAQGLNLLLWFFASWFMFKEKPNKKSVLGVILVFIGLVAMILIKF